MRSRKTSGRLLNVLQRVAWAVFLVSLPVTSFPFFPDFLGLGNAVVRPLALYPLMVLMVVEVLPYLLKRGKIPALAFPLIAFCLVAAASTMWSFVTPAFPVAGQSPFSRSVRAYMTLAIGLAFLLAAWRVSASRLGPVFTARWILVGSAISLLWGCVQAIRLNVGWPGYEQMNILHRLISVRDMHLYRVNGLAYEPSWHADHIVVFTIPLLFAACVTGVHPFGRGRRAVWISGAFIAMSIINLVFSYSRGGMAVFLGVLMLLVILESSRRMIGREKGASDKPGKILGKGLRRIINAKTLAWFAGGLLTLYGLGSALSRNYYFQLVWARLGRISNLQNYLISIGSGPRLSLWQAALGVFLDHPYLGVGLGQSGFWMWDYLPVWSFNYRSEIMVTYVSASMGYPNPKNLWLRLLAETGLLGTSLYLVFVLLLVLLALNWYLRGDRQRRFVGLFGLLSLAAISVEGFSLDSLANPTLWVPMGLIMGALHHSGPTGIKEAADA